MEEVFYYSELYDIYGSLLTDKQRLYFEDYYFRNLSLAEIADSYSVSRNAIFNQLQIIIKHLEEYDSKLELLSKKKKIEELINRDSKYVLVSELKDIFK